LENGDLNWIIPKKFVAFMGPLEFKDDKNYSGHHPSKYFDIFKKMNVTRVIRLNEERYDKMLFVN
jgi:cell division cycle 14